MTIVDRRSALKVLGGAAVGLVATSGRASATPLTGEAQAEAGRWIHILRAQRRKIRTAALVTEARHTYVDPRLESQEEADYRLAMEVGTTELFIDHTDYIRYRVRGDVRHVEMQHAGSCAARVELLDQEREPIELYHGPCNAEHPTRDMLNSYLSVPRDALATVVGEQDHDQEACIVLMQDQRRYWISPSMKAVRKVELFGDGKILAGEILFSELTVLPPGVAFPFKREIREYYPSGDLKKVIEVRCVTVDVNGDISKHMSQLEGLTR